MYYLCADDSTILRSWPEYPTANTVFPLLYLPDMWNSSSPDTLSPWSSAWNLFLLQDFLFPGIEQPFTQVLTLETLASFSTQVSFPFSVNHWWLYIQPPNCLKGTCFSIHTAIALIQATPLCPPNYYHKFLPPGHPNVTFTLLIFHKSPKQSFLSGNLTFIFLKSFNIFLVKSRICNGNYLLFPFFILSTNVYWEWLCAKLYPRMW